MSEYPFKPGDKVRFIDTDPQGTVRVVDYVGSAIVVYTVTTPVNAYEQALEKIMFSETYELVPRVSANDLLVNEEAADNRRERYAVAIEGVSLWRAVDAVIKVADAELESAHSEIDARRIELLRVEEHHKTDHDCSEPYPEVEA